MVVGGYSKDESNKITRDPETSLLKDVELISSSPLCSKAIRSEFND